MMKTFGHPKPGLDRFTQYILAAALLLLVISAPLQVLFGLALPGGRLFILTGLISLVLALPLLMGVSVHPVVSVDDEGLTLHPVIWRERRVTWDEVREIKDYPLLPSEDMEANRRHLVGKRHYRPAAGKMLVIPSLPFQYRAAGWFAGEGFTGIIALTSRTHVDYDDLIKRIGQHLTV
jgi:hypothetical protein